MWTCNGVLILPFYASSNNSLCADAFISEKKKLICIASNSDQQPDNFDCITGASRQVIGPPFPPEINMPSGPWLESWRSFLLLLGRTHVGSHRGPVDHVSVDHVPPAAIIRSLALPGLVWACEGFYNKARCICRLPIIGRCMNLQTCNV